MASTNQVTSVSYVIAFTLFLLSVFYQLFGPHQIARDLLPSSFTNLLTPSSSVERRSLIIGISSTLERIEQRQAIRKTWKQLLRPLGDQVELIFFVPERPCPIDPYWRIRDEACVPWHVFLPTNVNEHFVIKPCRVQPSRITPSRPYDGIGFLLKFPLNFMMLGLSRRALQQWAGKQEPVREPENRFTYPNLTLELVNPNNFDDVHLSANFSAYELERVPSEDGFIYLKPESGLYATASGAASEETLPRSFEAVLKVRQNELDLGEDLFCNLVWNKMFGDDGLVHFTTLWTHGSSRPAGDLSNACPLVSFIYRIPDLVELRQVINARDTQNKCQVNKIANLAPKLVEETEDFDDLVVLPDVQDVVENKPLALLKFFRLIRDKFDFEFAFISDDTTFVAADRLLSKLQSDFDGSWRARFRTNTLVNHHSRGGDRVAERNYVSSRYPALPSASGSVLSKDLVDLLAENADTLAQFKDIPSSLAVWLAPFNPLYLDDSDFSPNNETCSKSTVAFGPFTDAKAMRKVWARYKKCGNVKHQFEVGMTCESCVGVLESILSKLKGEGVTAFDINLDEKMVTVTSSLPVENLTKEIEKLGKPVKYVGTK